MFHRKKTDPKEAAKEAKRVVRRGERDLEREMRQLDRSEQSLIAEIKKAAKSGNQGPTRILAKQLVTLRGHREQLLIARSKIRGVGLQTSAAATAASVAGAMKSASGAMAKVNAHVNPQEMAKVMQQFSIETGKIELSEEMMDDALIDAFDGEGVEAGADAVVNQVLAEIGLDVDGQMSDAPTHAPPVATKEDTKLDEQTEEMLKKLDAL